MEPVVYRDGKKRAGRGVSRGEMKKAGIDVRAAKRYKLRMDPKRRTVYDENVTFIKKYIEDQKKTTKSKAKPKKKSASPKKKPAAKKAA